MVVSGDEELAGLGLHLLIPLQSDDCCHCGEHWDVCNQQPHTDRQTDRQTDTVTQDLNAMAEFNPIPTSQMLMLALFPVSFQKRKGGRAKDYFQVNPQPEHHSPLHERDKMGRGGSSAMSVCKNIIGP